ncbi:MAG: cation transporter [Desulfobacteraceae bacterium]|nr:cation transporter [Desulfobacteraceae bacterium]
MPVVTVKGMRCQHCVASVTKALTEVDGVKDVAVSLEKGEVIYTETKPVDMAEVKAAINRIGFEAV